MNIAAVLAAETPADTSVNILSLNVTLVIEVVAFLLLLAILSKWVYPPIVTAADKRQRQIDDAVKAAEAGRKEIAAIQRQIAQALDDSREEARTLIAAAQREAGVGAEVTRRTGRETAQTELDKARATIATEREKAAADLHSQVVTLVTAAAARLAAGAVDEKAAATAAGEVLR